MKILVTGGAGYIGSHTTLALLDAGHEVVVVDNLCNSSPESLRRVTELANRAPMFIEADIRDIERLRQVFREHTVDSVIHFAGLKAVGESVADPLRYYDNNVHGSLALLQTMHEAGVRRIVFSSSATVYGDPVFLPYTEDHPLNPTNPYGMTKLVVENLLRDVARSDPAWRIAILRYFNPVGAHDSGRIGEDPRGVPNNLMPFVAQVAVGRREKLQVFGGDYNTPDGTGVRDYIHVVDLADAHLRAVDYLDTHPGVLTVNVGTGQGISVLELVNAFAEASGRRIPYEIVARRAGDLPAYYADAKQAKAALNWLARRDLATICMDTWRWQKNNPKGF